MIIEEYSCFSVLLPLNVRITVCAMHWRWVSSLAHEGLGGRILSTRNCLLLGKGSILHCGRVPHAIEKNMIVIQNKNILASTGSYIYKLSTRFLLSRKNSRRGVASLSAWREGASNCLFMRELASGAYNIPKQAVKQQP